MKPQQINTQKLFHSSQIKLHNLATNFFIFGTGLMIGITLTLCLKDPIFYFPLNQFFIQSPPLPPQQNITSAAAVILAAGKEKIEKIEKIKMQNIQDKELLKRAIMVNEKRSLSVNGIKKVAFMFLSKGNLPLAPLWEKFFEGHQGFYSIYVHPQPYFNGTVNKDSVFHGKRVNSKIVEWGKFNMVEAERRLLANALLDTSNERFVLLSESCIPLFNFSTVYSYLMNSTTSFVESYDQPGPVGRGRFNRRMKPQLTLDQWRKGSQWFEMKRDLAIEVIKDNRYFPLFKRYCKPPCYADEHYLPTFVTLWFGKMNAERCLTSVDWSNGGPHPTKYGRLETTIELLEWMRSGSNCVYNGERTNLCFLFARKFLPSSLDRLLRFAPKVMHFG